MLFYGKIRTYSECVPDEGEFADGPFTIIKQKPTNNSHLKNSFSKPTPSLSPFALKDRASLKHKMSDTDLLRCKVARAKQRMRLLDTHNQIRSGTLLTQNFQHDNTTKKSLKYYASIGKTFESLFIQGGVGGNVHNLHLLFDMKEMLIRDQFCRLQPDDESNRFVLFNELTSIPPLINKILESESQKEMNKSDETLASVPFINKLIGKSKNTPVC